MNEKCLSSRGPEVTIMDVTEKLQAFIAKLSIWKRGAEADILANFQILKEVLYQDGIEIQNSLSVSLKREFCKHMENFRTLSEVMSIFMTLKLNHGPASLF
jgi:hypothetical protein